MAGQSKHIVVCLIYFGKAITSLIFAKKNNLTKHQKALNQNNSSYLFPGPFLVPLFLVSCSTLWLYAQMLIMKEMHDVTDESKTLKGIWSWWSNESSSYKKENLASLTGLRRQQFYALYASSILLLNIYSLSIFGSAHRITNCVYNIPAGSCYERFVSPRIRYFNIYTLRMAAFIDFMMRHSKIILI